MFGTVQGRQLRRRFQLPPGELWRGKAGLDQRQHLSGRQAFHPMRQEAIGQERSPGHQPRDPIGSEQIAAGAVGVAVDRANDRADEKCPLCRHEFAVGDAHDVLRQRGRVCRCRGRDEQVLLLRGRRERI